MMSKLIVQSLLSLFVSLGVVVGLNPDARGAVEQVWQDANVMVQETAYTAFSLANGLTSEVNLSLGVDAGAETNAASASSTAAGGASAQTQGEAEAGIGLNVDTSASAESGSDDGFFLNFGGETEAGLNFGLGAGR